MGTRSPSPFPSRLTALLVDDDRIVRVMLGDVLSRAGYAVLLAADGESALQTSASCAGTLDLLVTDVTMPGMTGWELADRVRGEQPEVKIVVISGGAWEPRRAPAVGVEFLRKPFAPQTLIESARRLLRAD